MSNFLLAIDQGTTSTRAILFNAKGEKIDYHQLELKQYFPNPGWVEHDPEEIWQSTLTCCKQVLAKTQLSASQIAGIGITNQRETTVIWDRQTGIPIHKAIVWQDRRTMDLCDSMRAKGYEPAILAKTGLLLDPYFSASKIVWLLDHVPGARSKAEDGKLAFGTIDCFLLWRLTQGKTHATDATNAARTLLFNIHNGAWDKTLLDLFNVPSQILPQVLDNTAEFGKTDAKLFGSAIPIRAMAGDQQSALIGQACFTPGMVKSTYGTGTFLILNTGYKAITSKNRLLTTIAYRMQNKTTYALEGSVFCTGSTIQWLRDNLKVLRHADESESLAASVPDNAGVYFVPAFTGLGAPYWVPDTRANIQGLTRDTQIAHIVRAALEAVAYQTCDLLDAMMADGNLLLTSVKVDGGMTLNNWLMQFLAGMLGLPIERPVINETTALGVAYLAGLQAGIFQSLEEISELWQCSKRFEPTLEDATRQTLYTGWKLAVKKTL
jgi:glycerol kinase